MVVSKAFVRDGATADKKAELKVDVMAVLKEYFWVGTTVELSALAMERMMAGLSVLLKAYWMVASSVEKTVVAMVVAMAV